MHIIGLYNALLPKSLLHAEYTSTISLKVHWCCSPSPPIDIIWAMMILWRIRWKIIRTVLCCVVYDGCAQWYVHMWAVLKDDCWFRFSFSFFCICL